jgi:replicative DNA helicase
VTIPNTEHRPLRDPGDMQSTRRQPVNGAPAQRTSSGQPDGQFDRLPPQDLAAEQCVLGGMLLSKTAIGDVTGIIERRDFYRPVHVTIFDAILDLHGRGEPADAITVAAALADAGDLVRVGGAPYLHTLISTVPTAANAAYYARTVAKKGEQRRVIEIGTKLIQIGYLGRRDDDDDLVGRAGQLVSTELGSATQRRSSSVADLMHSGSSFVLDVPTTVPAVWGEGEEILWSEGESLIIAGPSGVGKTTLTGQLLRGRVGLLDSVLGLPVKAGGRVLYLAMDRPDQIRRAMHRIFTADERDVLDEACVFWKGPPPRDIGKHPETLLEMADAAQADTIIVDSVKDAAIGLVDDEVGASYNRARQLVLADGRQLLELHHVVKRGNGGAAPNTLADVYGSAHLVNGAGSVVMLWGSAGDPIVDFRHLKQPRSEVGPFKVLHEGLTGTSSVWDGADLLELARKCASGVTAADAACVMYSTVKPSPSQIEKGRRRLERMTAQGLLTMTGGGKGRGSVAKWFLTAPPSWGAPDIDGGR